MSEQEKQCTTHHYACECREKVFQECEWLLEMIKSQMCWEQDRDQLSMGFKDLHTSVTKVLNKIKKLNGGL